MGKFDNIIIISDVDGTFLGKDSRIVPENVEAINYFNANGGKFTFISGRTPIEFRRLIPQVNMLANLPVGCSNGIYLYDFQSNTPLMDITLESTTLYTAFSPYIDTVGRTIQIYGVHDSEFYGFLPQDFEFISAFPEKCHTIQSEDLKAVLLNKLVILGEKDEIFSIRDNVIGNYSDTFHSVHSLPYAIEYIKKGSSKASTVDKIREVLSNENPRIFAIGDYQNDIEMLHAADYSASPSNALPEISNITDIHVCHHDKGAIADLIRIIEEKYIG